MNSLARKVGISWRQAGATGIWFSESRSRWLVVSVAMCLVASGGCRSQRERYVVDAFSAEARMLEDKIYELQDRVGTLERRLVQQRSGEPPSSRPTPARPPRGDVPPSRPPVPGFDLDEIPDLTPPEVDPGSPANPADFGEVTGRSRARPVAQSQAVPPGSSSSALSSAARQVASHDSDRQISELSFDAYLLGDAPADGSRVHGLELLIVPVNDREQLVPVAGEVTVVVLNSQDASHVGRWEYDAATARAALQVDGSDPGILLELRWREVLTDPRLHVFVRFELPDGRRFEADRPFVVAGKSAEGNRSESGSSAKNHPGRVGEIPGGSASEASAAGLPQELSEAAVGESTELPGELPTGPVKESPAGTEPTPRTAGQREQGPPAAIYR